VCVLFTLIYTLDVNYAPNIQFPLTNALLLFCLGIRFLFELRVRDKLFTLNRSVPCVPEDVFRRVAGASLSDINKRFLCVDTAARKVRKFSISFIICNLWTLFVSKKSWINMYDSKAMSIRILQKQHCDGYVWFENYEHQNFTEATLWWVMRVIKTKFWKREDRRRNLGNDRNTSLPLDKQIETENIFSERQ